MTAPPTATGTKVAAAAASAAAVRVLCDAAAAGNLAELRRALDGVADPNASLTRKKADREEYEATVLATAAANWQLEAAALLLDRSAQRAQTSRTATALPR